MKIKNILNVSLGNKIVFLLLGAVLPMILIMYLIVLPIVEQNYVDNRKKELKSVVESAYSILEIYNKKADAGLLTSEDAQQQAIDDINSLRYAGKEYFFIYDMNGIVMALGSAPEKRGENRIGFEDSNGKKFVSEMVSIARNSNEGFLTYYYPRLGETTSLPKLSFIKSFKKWDWLIGSGLYIDDIEVSVGEFKKEITYPVIIVLIVVIIAGFFFSRKISTPLKRIAEKSNLISEGNFSQKFDQKDIELKDEVGQLTKSLSAMVNNITNKVFWYEQILDTIPYPISVTDSNMNWTFVNKAVEDLLKIKRENLIGTHCSNMNAKICKTKDCGVQRLRDGFRDTYFEQFGKNFNIDTSDLKDTKGNTIGHIEVLIDITEIKAMENYLTESTNRMLTVMDKFAEGDLNVSLIAEKNDDVGKLYAGFNKAVGNIKNLISKVFETVEATANSSAQISTSTEEMAAGAQEQSTQSNEVATAVEEMTKTIIETTRNASAAAENAKKAGEIAAAGGKAVEDTVNGMIRIAEVVLQSSETVKQLGRNSDQIGEIIQVIDDIADQTNLLALNAAIEAARAGDQGRGFAVVADEVRKLAERTSKATREIADMIKHIQKDTSEAVVSMNKGTQEVEKGKELAFKAGESLKEIINATVKVVDDINQVACASEEQSSTAEQISKSIESISNVTNESSTGIQQVANTAEGLNRLTDNLQKLISNFKLLSEEKEEHYSVRQNGKLVQL